MIKMRKRGKKLGLLGMLFAAGASIVGCGSASKPVDEIETLRTARRARTVQSINEFNEGIQKIGNDALRDYANTAATDQERDMKILDSAQAERDRAIELGEKLYEHMQSTIGSKAPRYSEPSNRQKDSELILSATATQRMDGEGEPVLGGELEYKTGNGTYVTVGTTPEESTTESNAAGSLERTWTSWDASIGKYVEFGNWTAKAGIGVNMENIDTEGQVGMTFIDDQDSKTTPIAEVGLGYTVGGSVYVEFGANHTLGKDDDGNYTTTATVKAGVKF